LDKAPVEKRVFLARRANMKRSGSDEEDEEKV
jgi:hypothetical protein